MGQRLIEQATHGTLVELLTRPRLSSYERATDSTDDALRLYEWNMRATASVSELAGMVEIVVRNALDRELSRWAGRRGSRADWFDRTPLDQRGREDLTKARARVARLHTGPEDHGRVIAELTFGFWRYLVGSKYHAALWVPDLHRAFRHGPPDLRVRRAEVQRRLTVLHQVRNRAAHHEPIHRRDLRRDHAYAVELLSWVHPVAGAWAADRTSLPAVLDARPTARPGA